MLWITKILILKLHSLIKTTSYWKQHIFLKEDILEYSKQLGDATEEWLPTYDNLLEKIQIPELLELLFMQLLKNTKNVSSKTETVTESLAANVIFPVTQVKLLTLTYFVLAMDLHSITGSPKVIDIVSKLGECIDYIRQRETSQVVKAQKLANISSCLPLLPLADSDTLDTYFWVNNFNHVVEKIAGGNAVSTTHLMAFQEPKSVSRRSVSLELENFLSNLVINTWSCLKRWTLNWAVTNRCN